MIRKPTRSQFQKFVTDQHSRLALEELFDSVNTITSGNGMFVTGDIVWSAATTRAGALAANGQAVSRTAYATLFAAISTTFGAGDGSTTFNLPDITGRVVAGKESAAARLTVAGSGINGATLGATGGAETNTLDTAKIPSHVHSGAVHTHAGPGHTHTISHAHAASSGDFVTTGGAGTPKLFSSGVQVQTVSKTGDSDTADSGSAGTGNTGNPTAADTGSAGSGNAHANVQPTIVLNAFIIY